VLAAIVAGSLGCAGSALRAADLPDAPIAIHWRDPETARKYAEWRASQQESAEHARHGRPGVPSVDDLADYLAMLAGTGQGPPSQEAGAGRLALLDPRSGDVSPVETALRDAIPVVWSEPGRRLVFSQYEGDARQLYELDIERGEVRRLTQGPNAHSRGCLLPDGSLVASSAGPARAADGGYELVSRIERRRPGGASPEPISAGPADHSPTCAPDGSAIVWVSRGPKGRESLVSRTPPEAEPRAIGPGRDPSFSHDGQWVIYASPFRRSWRILRVRPDGTGRAPVGESTQEEHQPAFSPDGRLAIVVVHAGSERRLHVRRLDGSGDRILFDDGDAEFPVW